MIYNPIPTDDRTPEIVQQKIDENNIVYLGLCLEQEI